VQALRWSAPTVLALSLALVVSPGRAEAAPKPLADLDPAEEAALGALAGYPEADRRAILLAATRPERLVEGERIRARTRAALDALLEAYDREAQELLWSLVPHPGLVAELAQTGAHSRADLEAIAARYPEEVREAALSAGQQYPRALARIHALHASAERDFEALIADLPAEVQGAFRTLLARPEALGLLADHAPLAVRLGEAFERDPEGTSEWLRERARELAQAGAADAEAASAAAAAYREERPAEAAEPVAAGGSTTVHVHHYPYWFGYPSWIAVRYPYYGPCYWWYPRPYWPWYGVHFGPRWGFSVVLGGPYRKYPHWKHGHWKHTYGHGSHRIPAYGRSHGSWRVQRASPAWRPPSRVWQEVARRSAPRAQPRAEWSREHRERDARPAQGGRSWRSGFAGTRERGAVRGFSGPQRGSPGAAHAPRGAGRGGRR
jgi:hypothetical protein